MTHAPSTAADPVALDPAANPQLRTLAVHGGTPVSAETIQLIAVRLEEEEIEAVVGVMRSGRLAQGAVVKEFESAFAEATGAKHAIACSNGTTALQLVYEILLERDQSALVPAWTFIATASMVRARPAIPRFVDVREDTFTIDLGDAQRRLGSDTKIIVPVHLYGNPADIECVEAFATRHGLRTVYDAAQSHLATYRGEPLGRFGDAVTYSFYPTKNMTTGEGGMITTNDDGLADALRVVRDHGMRIRYQHERIGFNYRMTDIFAAIGIAQLRRLPEATERRQANAAILDAMLANVDGVAIPVAAAHATHAYHLYTIRLDPATLVCDRDTFVKAVNAEGIATAIHYPRPLHKQPVFEADPEVECPSLPVAERLADRVLSLPVHPHLTEAEVRSVATAVTKVAASYRR